MAIYAGCFINGDRPDNLPTVHICDTEQELVAKLQADAGEDLEGLAPTTLDELQDFIGDYCENSYSGISWEVRE